MELASVFKFSLYSLTALAAWILGRAEDGVIPYATFPVLIAAYLITETGGGRSLAAGPANLIGALAVAAAAWEFSQPGQEAKLLSGAHLLVYATWIVMFQEKSYRLYWWVMALGVLQVAVASVLQPGPWYGFFLILYVSAALGTMSVAAMYQVQQQFVAGDPSWKWEAPSQRPDEMAVLVRPAVQLDESQRWLTRRFLGGLAVLIVMSLSVSAGFFALTPRIWFGPQNLLADEESSALERRNAVTGFAREVRLGDMGQILESVKPVFSIRCRDALSGDPLSLQDVATRLGMSEPLFRGSVMTEYAGGRWVPDRSDQPVRRGRTFNRPGFVQEVTLEPSSDEVLFCVGTPEAVEISGRREDAYLHMSTGILTRELRSDDRQRLSYSVFVSPMSAEMVELHAAAMPQGLWWQQVDREYLRRNLRFDERRLPTVTALAERLQAELETKLQREATALELGQYFDQHLRSSGEYGYTLNLTVVDSEIDPLEDFLVNRKEGHCEYYASTLTLMLRAIGIPARLVSGFKGAEFNGLRGSWEVQERFAHAWVEAWSAEHRLWFTLDPTPGEARSQSVETVSNKLGFWGHMRSNSTMIWQDYVVNVNLRQQQERLYGPLRDFFEKLVAVFNRVVAWAKGLWHRGAHFITHPSEWLSITGGVVTFTVLTLLVAITRGGWWLFQRLKRLGWAGLWLGESQPRLMIAFYERYLRVLKKAGWQRKPSQTPLEFADQVQQRLDKLPGTETLIAFPEQFCRAFYRIRFGGEELPATELQQLELQLNQLETLLHTSAR